jgi:hypothetical protein
MREKSVQAARPSLEKHTSGPFAGQALTQPRGRDGYARANGSVSSVGFDVEERLSVFVRLDARSERGAVARQHVRDEAAKAVRKDVGEPDGTEARIVEVAPRLAHEAILRFGEEERDVDLLVVRAGVFVNSTSKSPFVGRQAFSSRWPPKPTSRK